MAIKGQVCSTAIAGAVTTYSAKVQDRRLFPIKAVRINGGSKFIAGFEAACQDQRIALFVLPPRSPKLNGQVERTNGTSRREFWELYAGDRELPPLPRALPAREAHDNHERPHQALGYRTPAEHLAAVDALQLSLTS